MNQPNPFALFACCAGLILLTACASTTTMQNQAAIDDYQATLAQLDAQPTIAPGSAAETAAIQRFKDFFADLTAESVREKTTSTYAPDVFFNDTLKTIRGNEALEHYFLETAHNTKFVRATVQDVARSGPNYYVRWVMDVEFTQFKKGQPVQTIGITHLRFDDQGRIALHQDFWDSSAGLYEHIPVLGALIRTIKARF